MEYVLGPATYAKNGWLTVRIADDARRCVLFFGQETPPAGLVEYGGTGFLVSFPHDGMRSQYLITCRHVAKKLKDSGGFFIRANLKGGGSEPIAIEDMDWAYHPDETVDLAAIPYYHSQELDHIAYGLEGTLDCAKHKAHCGDPINIVGLFRLRSGTHRSTPIVHCGHIAALADPNERVPVRDRTTEKKIEVEAYLVEAQTLEGLSGSPVFTHYYVGLKDYIIPEGGVAKAYGRAKLLGVYIGAWDGEAGELLARDRNWKGDQRVPLGMGLVVPFEKIMELLMDDPRIKAHRQARVEERQSKNAAAMDSGFSEPQESQAESPKGEPNANHKEAFTSLLNAASKKNPPAG